MRVIKPETLFFLVAALVVSASGQAKIDSDCHSLTGEYAIQLNGNTFHNERPSYHYRLKFEPEREGFVYAIDWLDKVESQLNTEALIETWSSPTQKRADICRASSSPLDCLRRLAMASTYLDIARKDIRAKQPLYKEKLQALHCAEQRLAHYAEKIQTWFLKP
jgi:hypothetical protein